MTVWSIGTIGCGVAQGFWSFFASRAMVGSGEAVMGPGAQSLLREFFPPEKLGFAFSVFSLSSSIGAGLAFAIGGLAGTLIDPSAVHEVLRRGRDRGAGRPRNGRYALLICAAIGLPLCALSLCFALKPVRAILTGKIEQGKLPDAGASVLAGH